VVTSRTRTALAEPQPPAGEVGELVAQPTFQELYNLAAEYDGEPVQSMQAALARWGRPVPQPTIKRLPDGAQVIEPEGRTLLVSAPRPIPVTERLPEAGDCKDEGWAWFFNPRVGWRQAVFPVSAGYTHWLPAHALPLPAAEVE
jgi:hypothetical protein